MYKFIRRLFYVLIVLYIVTRFFTYENDVNEYKKNNPIIYNSDSYCMEDNMYYNKYVKKMVLNEYGKLIKVYDLEKSLEPCDYEYMVKQKVVIGYIFNIFSIFLIMFLSLFVYYIVFDKDKFNNEDSYKYRGEL